MFIMSKKESNNSLWERIRDFFIEYLSSLKNFFVKLFSKSEKKYSKNVETEEFVEETFDICNHVVKNSLYGFVIGDAMGVPVEFIDRETLAKNPVISMRGYGTYNMPKGTWSDDTSMTLATMDSIIRNNGDLNCYDVADRFCNWYNNAEYTATNKVFDIGNQTKKALKAYQEDTSNFRYKDLDVRGNGNGSLMRMLPVALYCHYKDLNNGEVLNVVSDLSAITHPHEISIMGCYIYVKYIMFLLDGKDKLEAYNMLKGLDYNDFTKETTEVYSRILKQYISKISLDEIKSTGYIVHTLEAVMWLTLNCNNYNKSIITAVNLGEDTDTIAAITGSITGMLYGFESIDKDWLKALKNKKYLNKIIVDFEEKMKNININEIKRDNISDDIHREYVMDSKIQQNINNGMSKNF